MFTVYKRVQKNYFSVGREKISKGPYFHTRETHTRSPKCYPSLKESYWFKSDQDWLRVYLYITERGNNCAEPRVLPAVRVPVKGGEPLVSHSPNPREKSSSGSQTAAETWLDEARREAGISKPYTVSALVSLCAVVSLNMVSLHGEAVLLFRFRCVCTVMSSQLNPKLIQSAWEH